MFGVERMRGDPEPQLPYTNQFIADLAAMPSVQVVFMGDERNRFAFNAWAGGKVLVSPWLRGGLCSSRVAKRAVRQRQWAGLGSNNRVDTVTVESILKAGCRSSPTSII